MSSVTVGVWRFLQITVFGTYQGESTIMRKTLDGKRSGISVYEVEAVPQSRISVGPDWFECCFVYENFVACGGF
jgi:hypothetical protein